MSGSDRTGGGNRQFGVGWRAPFDNSCENCGAVWRSRGEPLACPDCGADVAEHGESNDLFARLRGLDDDPLDALRRELERRLMDPDAKGLPEFTERVEPRNRDLPAGRSYRTRNVNHSLWKEQRSAARERDGGRCQGCGIREEHHREYSGQSLHVHHIVPRSEFDDPEERHALSNLICLCLICHRDLEELDREALRDETDRDEWLETLA